jgi:hypothetical protein
MAALFFLGLLGAIHVIQHGTEIPIGMILLVAAVALHRAVPSTFLNQIALAFLIAGQVLILGRILGETRGELLAVLPVFLILLAILYPLYPTRGQRFLTMIIGQAVLLAANFWRAPWQADMMVLLWGPVMVFLYLGPLLTQRWLDLARMAGLGFACWLLALLSGHQGWDHGLSRVGLIVLTLVAFRLLLERSGRFSPAVQLCALGLLVAFGAITSPGLLGSVLLLGLGFGLRDRYLRYLGLSLLVIFLIHFYYSLTATLMAKSLILVGSGLLLLLGHVLLRFGQPAREVRS